MDKPLLPLVPTSDMLNAAVTAWHQWNSGKANHGGNIQRLGQLMWEHMADKAPTSDNRMWAVNIEGPDDLYAAPDRAVADAVALLLNRQFARQYPGAVEFGVRAVVIEWPHSYETWAAEKDSLRFDVTPVLPSLDEGEQS